jgi:hypothetical protein
MREMVEERLSAAIRCESDAAGGPLNAWDMRRHEEGNERVTSDIREAVRSEKLKEGAKMRQMVEERLSAAIRCESDVEATRRDEEDLTSLKTHSS